VCITTNQPYTKSNPNNDLTAKQHAIVGIQLNIVACPAYKEKFIPVFTQLTVTEKCVSVNNRKKLITEKMLLS